jgi:hypothetical protein
MCGRFVSPRGYLYLMKLREILKSNCPKCGGNNSLRKILYGLPMEEPDDSKYVLGGCCPPEIEPDVQCGTCGWQGISSQDLIL